jgi:hypothetical protein
VRAGVLIPYSVQCSRQQALARPLRISQTDRTSWLCAIWRAWPRECEAYVRVGILRDEEHVTLQCHGVLTFANTLTDELEWEL